MMDHKKQTKTESGEEKPDMQYLTKPRGKGYALRMATPEVLIGFMNPWTRKPFGKEIKLGLKTRSYFEAIRQRDIKIGQIRQLEEQARDALKQKRYGRIIDLSPEMAEVWREQIEATDTPWEIEMILDDELERAEKAGKGNEALRFAQIVYDGAVPLERALEQYLQERSDGNPYGYDPLAKTTAQNVRSSMKHLIEFLGGESPTLQDVTPEKAFQFRTEYLPLTAKVKSQTVAKHITLLRGLWTWAISDKKYLKSKRRKSISNPWVVEHRGTPKKRAKRSNLEEVRTAFSAVQVEKLLGGFAEWGSRQGDLMRLALVTGCRVDELGSLLLQDVMSGGGGFFVRYGKTENAKRFVPVVDDAQRLLGRRVEKAIELQTAVPVEKRRLFPEWPLKPSTNKVNAVSQWFTRYRREILGKETDGRLAMHSFRHTWRTTARRAGVPEDRINELGGWSQEKNTSWVYDHGLSHQQLTEAQAMVWRELDKEGYLAAF